MSESNEWYPSVHSLAELTAAAYGEMPPVVVVVPDREYACADRDDYRAVLETHNWSGKPLVPLGHKTVRESLCSECKARITLVWRTSDGGPLPAVAEFFNGRLTHRAWQRAGLDMEPVSHATFVAVWQAELDNSLRRHGVRRNSPVPGPPSPAPHVCVHESPVLPDAGYDDIEQRHDMTERFGNVRRSMGLAGVFTTVACHRCDARKVVLSRASDPEAPVAAAMVRYWRGNYGHGWQNIDGVLAEAGLDTVASILRGMTAAERLAQTRAGIAPRFIPTILQPRFSTAVDDWYTAMSANPS